MSNASTRTNQFAYDIIIECSAEMTKATARSLMSVVISRSVGTPLHHGFSNYLDRGVHERGLGGKKLGTRLMGVQMNGLLPQLISLACTADTQLKIYSTISYSIVG